MGTYVLRLNLTHIHRACQTFATSTSIPALVTNGKPTSTTTKRRASVPHLHTVAAKEQAIALAHSQSVNRYVLAMRNRLLWTTKVCMTRKSC